MATLAKPNLMEARRLLLAGLDLHPDRQVPSDLDPNEVGIVGDPAHIGGYHCGTGRLFYRGTALRDYSVIESTRDARGLKANPDWASALDVGQFAVTRGGRTHTLITFSAWLVGLCKAKDPDARDIREVIYSPDGRTVRRWDALGLRDSGDDSHCWHTHISEYRDADGSRMVRLVQRYLRHINGEDDDMQLTDKVRLSPVPGMTFSDKQTTVEGALNATLAYVLQHRNQDSARADALDAKLDLVLAKLNDADPAEIEAKLDALAAAEAARAQADADRDAVLLAAVLDDEAAPAA